MHYRRAQWGSLQNAYSTRFMSQAYNGTVAYTVTDSKSCFQSYTHGMIRIRLQNGKEATLEGGTWASDDDSLAAFLAIMMVDHGPGPADGDQEWACSHRIAERLQAEVVAFEPVPHEVVPGRVY